MPMLTTFAIGLARGAPPLAAANRVRERRHPVEHLVHLRDDVDPVDDERAVARQPQRDVEHRAVLRDVDVLAREHRVAPLGHAPLLGEGDEQAHRLVGDAVLREVEEEAGRLAGEALRPARIGGEELAQVDVPEPCRVLLQRLPGRRRPHAG